MVSIEKSLRSVVLKYCSDHPYDMTTTNFDKWRTKVEVAFSCFIDVSISYDILSVDYKTLYRRRKTIRKYIIDYIDELKKRVKFDDIFKDTPVIRKKSRKDKLEDLEDEPKSILPATDPGYFLFCRWLAVPRYAGLYEWQKEHHDLTWDSTYEMTLVPRDHGKTVQYVQKYQWAMQYKGMDVLLLGWTDRRKEAALYVYSFFYKNDLIEKDKRTSPFHFRTKGGGKFDCYLITSKETLGMHSEGDQNRFSDITEAEWLEFKGLFNEFDENETITEKDLKIYVDKYKKNDRKLWIAIDDPIDISFMKERHKEQSLELHHDSSLYPIHPFKWSYTGTHKFEGDFFDFIKAKFEDEVIVYKRTTMRTDGTPLCPEKFTHPDLPTYQDDLKDGKRCLATIRKHVGEYAWWAEYEQDPHPITGDVWDHVHFTDFIESPIHLKYDLCFITVDRATTTKVGSSYTGCLAGMRKFENRHLIIQHDWTTRIQLEELLIKINNFVLHFSEAYPGMPIFLIVETQGGGHDFLSMARNRVDFLYEGKRVPNVIARLCTIIEFHNIGEKLQRIRDRLYLPIRNHLIEILSSLQHSEIVDEILKFPYYPKLDAIDALANASFEMDKVATQIQIDPMEILYTAYKEFEDQKYGVHVVTPEDKEKEIRSRLKGRNQRSVMDNW